MSACPSTRLLARSLASVAFGTALCSGIAFAASSGPSVSSDRGCYLVGQSVRLIGSGFASNRPFEVAIDGVDFGQSTTDASGHFAAPPLIPGGLPAGTAQHVDHANVTDGTSSADTTFTVTRRPGSRFLPAGGSPSAPRARVEVWGFALDGKAKPVYLHYVGPNSSIRTFALGHARGQCGYLRTGPRRVFPFTPSLGRWTLQVDTSPRYSRGPSGPVSRIRVQVRKG